MTQMKTGGKTRKLSPWIKAATEYYPTVKDKMSYSDMLKSAEFRKYYTENHKGKKSKTRGGEDAPAAAEAEAPPADAVAEEEAPVAEASAEPEEEETFTPPPLERQSHIKSAAQQLSEMGKGTVKSDAQQLSEMGKGGPLDVSGGKRKKSMKKSKKNSKKTKKNHRKSRK